MIELRTLGGLELRDGRGRNLCGRLQPKRLALLIYLAHAPDRYHRRDSLMALFWPELDTASARNSLRQSLYEVRRSLGTRVVTGRAYEEIAVAADRLWSDVAAFESALKAGEAECALELYRGDLLEGFHAQNVAPEFEHWLERERVRLRNKAVRAASDLADLEESRGHLTESGRWAQRAARLDPDNESVLRKLVERLARAGDRAGAARAYSAFERRTREEYDLEPAEETQRLIEAMRAHSEPDERSMLAEAGILEPPTTFIGRERELAALEALLMAPGTRLVTLTGVGGAGKTRLALELARRMEDRFEGGVTLVGLGDIETEDGVLSAVARALGVREESRRGPREVIHHYLADRELLLVLDGFERIRPAGPEIIRLLQVAPRLKVLVTSRALLRVSGEKRFPVLPLSLPQPGLTTAIEFPLNSEAVALFIERARDVITDFRLTAKNREAVCGICRRLDGLPLAIELAAARVGTLSPREIENRLGERFAFLTGGPADRPLRHQSLEAAIGWSYDLLGDREQTIFRGLGVFAGGFSLDVAEPLFEASGITSVQFIDGLATLVDSSLISQYEVAGELRFEMLDTIQAYARKLLAESAGEKDWCHEYSKHLLAWVEDGERYYCSGEQSTWFTRLERERDNIGNVFRWAIDQDKVAIAMRLGASLWPFWCLRGHLAQARFWLERILAAEGRAPRTARAKALLGASWVASATAEHEQAAVYARQSAALYRATCDQAGYVRALETLGFVQLEAGEIECAESAFRECLERSRNLGSKRREAIALDALGQAALARGDDIQAETLFRESLSLARRIGHAVSEGHGLLCLGDIARRSGALDRATRSCEEALAILREAGQKINIAWALSGLGRVHVEAGRMTAAREAYAEALPLFQEQSYIRGMARTLSGFAAIALAEGDPERAALLLGGSEGLLERAGDHFAADDAAHFEALKDTAHERLRRPKFTARWAEGRSLKTDELITLALGAEPAGERRALG